MTSAAYRLFVQRGPAAVSVREIAAEAGVNLGLIHRYVGSKDDIIALVLDRHGELSRAALDRAEDLNGIIDLLASSPKTSSGRLFAGIALDGVDAIRLKREFPFADSLVPALRQETEAAESAHVSALLQSLVLGWEIFSPYLLEAAGAEPPDDEAALLREAMCRIAGIPRRPSDQHPIGHPTITVKEQRRE